MIDLQSERERKGMSQDELAAKIGTSRQSISAIERGIALPSVDNAKKIASVLGLKWSDFYEEADSKVSQ